MGPENVSRHKSGTQAPIFTKGRPNFLQSHKLNQIKPSNLKKFLDLVGVWMEPRNYGFHLGPKISSSQSPEP